ncbi:sporulation protein YabP [Youxingia wuxianensis]|nr:sporulation protein YabP [Youxingia wuxianensis]
MLMNEREEKMTVKTPHNIIMEQRNKLTITGVTDIDSFDEQTVLLFTGLGELAIRGENLHINRIDVDTGEVNLEGEIDSLTYADNQPNKGGFFGKLFK